ncbi:hypothetical protein LTR78_003686 [Recurvomyces mirabilis]|uniref:Uncharacterized protein n=1 Tax=Recurvomyces mirabilis TaxID=574656 RepID=A0AAE1C3A3_9PEZI|nr:hypothetical protein LTR78_003686 [Recurvomyces mirabilis]KAK5154798.1 hypothetical protein LTS14_006379 [Recurvomyces mirabilis]
MALTLLIITHIPPASSKIPKAYLSNPPNSHEHNTIDPDLFNKLLQSGGNIAEPAQAQDPAELQQTQRPGIPQRPQSLPFQQPQRPKAPAAYQKPSPPAIRSQSNIVATQAKLPVQSMSTRPMPQATSISQGGTPGTQAIKQAFAAAMQMAFDDPFISARTARKTQSLAAQSIRRMNAVIDREGEAALPLVVAKLHELDIDPAIVGLEDGIVDLRGYPGIMPYIPFGAYPAALPYGGRYPEFPPYGGYGGYGF